MRRAPRARILLTPKLSVRASSADLDASRLYPLTQLTSLYRNGGLIQKAAASKDTDRDAFTEQRASLGKEITRVEHAVDRHQDAFEDGNLNPARFTERLFSLDARLDSLRSQDQALARDLAADTPTTPDTAALNAVADQLGQVIETGDPDRTKALLRILIAELRQQPQRDPPHLPRRRTRGLHAKQSSGRNLAVRKPRVDGGASGGNMLTEGSGNPLVPVPDDRPTKVVSEMTRHVLIREGDKLGSVVAEAELPTEAELHDALTRYPELIPLSDLGMGTGVVIGRESSLAAGYADLVLVDESGQLCIVEVKNAGNPDTRRVVAQLLDYAASLWGTTVGDLTSRILHPYLDRIETSEPRADIGEFVARAVAGDDATPEQAAAISSGLANTLAAGDFALVVAAPQIPSGVQRVIEYLNARGQRLYGLEVSYFKGQVECFVPRLVVHPLVSDPAGVGARTTGIDRETFLASVADAYEATVSELLDECDAAGADLSWNKSGPSIFVTRGQRRQVGYIETTRLGIVLTTPSEFPAAPFDAARKELADAALGTETSSGWYRSISLTDPQFDKATSVLLDLISALVSEVGWTDLAEPVESSFTRNDFNVWEAHVPGLASLHGKALRAILMHKPSGTSATANLVPLAGGQPGWKPVFRPASGRDTVWSGATLGDPFTVEVSASD